MQDQAKKVKPISSTSIFSENAFTFSIKKEFLLGLAFFWHLRKKQTTAALLFRNIFGFVKAPGVSKPKNNIWVLVVTVAKNKSNPNPQTESH